jgi:hypothetical protein
MTKALVNLHIEGNMQLPNLLDSGGATKAGKRHRISIVAALTTLTIIGIDRCPH